MDEFWGLDDLVGVSWPDTLNLDAQFDLTLSFPEAEVGFFVPDSSSHEQNEALDVPIAYQNDLLETATATNVCDQGEHSELPDPAAADERTMTSGAILDSPQIISPAGDQVPPLLPSNKRVRGPSASRWSAHKSKIQKLYLEEEFTLKETSDQMRAQHAFNATPQMYKEKFQEWGFMKYIPRKMAGKLSQIAEKREPKATEFVIGPKKWSADEVRKKFNRGDKDAIPSPLDSPDLPQDLIWRTPTPISPATQNSLVLHSPQMRYQPSPLVSNRGWTPEASQAMPPRFRPWTPFTSGQASPLNQYPLNSIRIPSLDYVNQSTARQALPGILPLPTPNFPWYRPSNSNQHLHHLLASPRKQTVSELFTMKDEAVNLVDQGQRKAAIDKLRLATRGFHDLLGSTHQFTVSTGFELLELMAQAGDMDEADLVLNWLCSTLLENLHDERTIIHCIKLADTLQSWSRHQESKAIESKIGELWGDNAEIQRLFSRLHQPKDIDIKLRVVQVIMASGKEAKADIEYILKDAVTHCQLYQLLEQELQACLHLSQLYYERQNKKMALKTLNTVLPRVEGRLTTTEPLNKGFLSLFRETAFRFNDYGRLSRCEDLLEMTAEYLESRVRIFSTPNGLIKFLISIGVEWQRRSLEIHAKAWFQRSFATALRFRGPSCQATKALEVAALDGVFSGDVEKFLPPDSCSATQI